MNSLKGIFIIIFFFGVGVLSASAAVLSLVPEGQNFAVGQEFNIAIVLDTEDVRINAAQAVINFPPDLLQPVSVDRSKSVFEFWVEDPVVSNGALSFIGGTASGVLGKDLLIFNIRFKALKEGKSDLFLSDGVVTANDGKGTNVLSGVKGTAVTISGKVTMITAPPEQPKKIVRAPIISTKLPAKPAVKVNLYPDQSQWYNHLGAVLALWDVPDDTVALASAIDHSPVTIPTQFSTELFTGRDFGVLSDGIWYLHVRFKNNLGAGPTAHYRIAIDTKTPSFSYLAIIGGAKTDNPRPLISYFANDNFSGLDFYEIQVDDGLAIRTSFDSRWYTLSLQPPGRHLVKVKAVDKAGNIAEQSIDLEVLPIESPAITFLTNNIFIGEGGLIVRGTGRPDFIVKVFLKKLSGESLLNVNTTVDAQGTWEVVSPQILKKGKYFVEVIAQDERGAQSFPVKSEIIKVREKPLLTIAGIEITQFWFFIGLIIILLLGFVIGWFSYSAWRRQLNRRVIIAQRDIANLFEVIKKDLEKVLASYADKHLDQREISEIEFIVNRLKDNLEKAQSYVLENIKEISE